MSSMLVVKTAVCGYHVYRTVWESLASEESTVIQVRGNFHDRNLMAVYHCKEHLGVMVGNLPQERDNSIGLLNGILAEKSVNFFRLGAGKLSLTAAIFLSFSLSFSFLRQ